MNGLFRWVPILLIIGGISAPQQCHRKHVQMADLQRIDTLLSIEKTPCYGTCPSYVLHFLSNKTAILEARRFVPKEGIFIAHIDSFHIVQWMELARQCIYETSNESGPSRPIPDLPGMRVSIDDSTYFFQAIDAFPALRQLSIEADKFMQSAPWEELHPEKP